MRLHLDTKDATQLCLSTFRCLVSEKAIHDIMKSLCTLTNTPFHIGVIQMLQEATNSPRIQKKETNIIRPYYINIHIE